MKTLSLIIPAYNMASLLPRCLDSVISPETIGRIDVLVVNDGSSDDTREVAGAYAERYPQCVKLTDKSNGNYGSTINAVLPEVDSTYVKLLDADDWFDTDTLVRYLDELDALTEAVDISVCHFITHHADGTREVIRYNVYGREPYSYSKPYDLDEILGGGFIRFFPMHTLAYRTDLLKSIGYRQSEGISYTDIEWATFPLFHAKTIIFHNLALYQYYLGRDGQTMDPNSIARSLNQLKEMTWALIRYYKGFDFSKVSEARAAFIRQYYRNRLRILIKTHLLDIPRDRFNAVEFAALDAEIQQARKEMGLEQIKLYPVNKILHIDVYRYWCRHHDRLPEWLEYINSKMDSLMTFLFIHLFHR